MFIIYTPFINYIYTGDLKLEYYFNQMFMNDFNVHIIKIPMRVEIDIVSSFMYG